MQLDFEDREVISPRSSLCAFLSAHVLYLLFKIFVVRYDASDGQSYLPLHTDSSRLSFNVLLSSDFEGGGTWYCDPLFDRTCNLHPSVGEVLLNDALVLHEGLEVTRGRRYILVGFLSVDSERYGTEGGVCGRSSGTTGLSWYASRLSLPWLIARLGDAMEIVAHRREEREERHDDEEEEDVSTAGEIRTAMSTTAFLDWLAHSDRYLSFLTRSREALRSVISVRRPLTVTPLIAKKDGDEFVASLDRSYMAGAEAESSSAAAATGEMGKGTGGGRGSLRYHHPSVEGLSWFDGHGLAIDLDGTGVRLVGRERGRGY
mmetsp:Transcript_25615/g.47746  ORF Transcript_25615/g.47746 Transcript_25615/m.47746 type:complete len:317 (-) Transcript_25615:39-989(-)